MAENQQRTPTDRSRWLSVALCIGAVIYTFAGAWMVTAGPADPVEHTAAFIAHLVSPWMMASYAVAVAFIGFGIWHLHGLSSGLDGRDIGSVMRQTGIRLALVFAVVIVSLSAIGWLYIRDIRTAAYAERSRQLDLVARLQAQQIGKWLVARLLDSERLAASLARLPLERLPADKDLVQGIDLLFAETLAGNPERVAVTLFAIDGRVLLHVGAGEKPDDPVAAAVPALATAPAAAPRIVGIYDEGEPVRAHMGFLAPIAGRSQSSPAAAVVAITVDPFRGLLDQLQGLPMTGAASDVFVVRRDGGDVVFVTPPPPASSAAPGRNRVPLADFTLSAAQAIQRGDGLYRGLQQGTPVLGAARRVNGVPWIVLAQAGEATSMAPVDHREGTLVMVIGAAIALAGAMLLVLWRAEYGALRMQNMAATSERAAVSQHFAQLTRLTRDLVLLIDPAGRIIEANQAAITAYGYDEAELYRLSFTDLHATGEAERTERRWHDDSGREGVIFETVHRRKDGRDFPVEISGRVIDVDGRLYRQAFVRDIGARKALEHAVARLSQVRSALQAATSVALRAHEEAELYRSLCQVMVRLGGYWAAYVGLPLDDSTRSVRFAAATGVEIDYLEQLGITWSDGPRGAGPTGAALRTGEINVDQNMALNPALAPWRKEALKHGAHACIGLPLRADGRVLAALVLHAVEPDAFDADEVTLLAALADDIGFAIDRLRAGLAAA